MGYKVTPKNSTGSQRGVSRGDSVSSAAVDYETALDLAGYGRFSRSVLGACACAFFTTGVQNCLMSYVLPAARCELQLTTYQAGLINMAFMCGGVASAFFWGIVADVFGRRRVLSCTLILDGLLTICQSTVNDYRILVVLRCMNGFLIGGPSTLVFTYLSDLVGVRKRQLYLNVTGMSFVVAWLILPGLAWLVLPYNPSQYSPTLLPIYSWRLFLAVCSLPGFISGIWVLFLPESPRLLADTNRSEKAVRILAKIHDANSRKNNVEFKIKTITLSDMVVTKTMSLEKKKPKELFVGVLKDLKLFVSKMYAWKSTLILFVFFANMAAGFGLNLWIPEMLLRMQSQECKINSMDNAIQSDFVQNYSNSNNWSLPTDLREARDNYENETSIVAEARYADRKNEEEQCSGVIDEEIFTSGLIVGACCVLGNAACALLSSRGGAKGVQLAAIGCTIACSIACGFLAAYSCSCSTSNKIAVAAAAALNAASLNGNVLLIRLLLHAVPAKLSGLAVCWGAWWGRAGGVASNFAVGVLLDLSCPAPFVAVAVLLAVSVAAIWMIKLETSGVMNKDAAAEDTPTEKQEKTETLDKFITTHM